MTMAAAMAAIGAKTLPKYAPKSFSIWGAQIIGNTFRGSVPDLERTFTIVTGIVNLKRLMRRTRGWTPNTHRKRLKPGPKKPGPRGRKPRQTFKKQD